MSGGYLNKVQLIGRLGDDPEIKSLSTGVVGNFSIATTDSWKDKNTGEKKEVTQWHRCVCWSEGLCGVLETYVRKGMRVFVEGQLQTRKWQDQDGKDRYSTEVVLSGFDAKLIMLDRGKAGDRDPNGNAERPGNKPAAKPDTYAGQKGKGDAAPGRERGGDFGRGGGFARDLDDEIPF